MLSLKIFFIFFKRTTFFITVSITDVTLQYSDNIFIRIPTGCIPYIIHALDRREGGSRSLSSWSWIHKVLELPFWRVPLLQKLMDPIPRP